MSNVSDFVIKEGILTKYKGSGGDVVIPEGVILLGDLFSEAKYYGTQPPAPLTSIILPESMTAVDSNAFEYCRMLKKVVLPQTVIKIGGYAFADCVSLSDLAIPQGVTEIGTRAFAGCKKLHITLPRCLKVIEEAAFRDCAITSITMPASVTQIGKDAFARCNKITSAGPCGGGYDYEFPWTEEIPDNAFSGLRKLKTVVLPESIKKVGNNAFKDCKELVDITIPSAAQISKTAFKGCEKLGQPKQSQVETKPQNEMTDFVVVNDRLIQYNGHVADVIIPDGITVIGKRAFYMNSDIVSVKIPKSVGTIEQEAFSHCINLENVLLCGKIQKIGSGAFDRLAMRSILKAIPIRVFTKAAQYAAAEDFSYHLNELDATTDVFKDNLAFIGLNLNCGDRYSAIYKLLMYNADLRHAVLSAVAIPLKGVEWFLEQIDSKKNTEIWAELLDYKNTQLQDPAEQKKKAAAQKKVQENALSIEITPAEWRKIFKFANENDAITIKEIKIRTDVVTIPANIGNKKVRTIATRALFFGCWDDLDAISPKKVIISEGVEEIRSGAFWFVKKADIYIPSTVVALSPKMFVYCKKITLHLPATLTEIPNDFCDKKDIQAICAPAGSYAEQYAKENNIPFVAE